ELDAEAPAEKEKPPDDLGLEELRCWEEGQRQRLDRAARQRVVGRLRDEHSERVLWESVVEGQRQASARAAQKDRQAMAQALQGKRCLCHFLDVTYSDPEGGVRVGGTCAGCPACRRRRELVLAPEATFRRDVWPGRGEVGAHLAAAMRGRRVLW